MFEERGQGLRPEQNVSSWRVNFTEAQLLGQWLSDSPIGCLPSLPSFSSSSSSAALSQPLSQGTCMFTFCLNRYETLVRRVRHKSTFLI